MHRRFAPARFPAAVVAGVVAAGVAGVAGGCGGGELIITTSGEDFIETAIPSAFFADGGSVAYTKFLVTFSELTVNGADGTVGGAVAGPVVFDLHEAGPAEVATLTGLEARRYEDISVAVGPATDDTLGGNAASDDVEFMKAQGFSVFVEGSVSQNDADKTFAWGFNTNTRYVDCTLEDGSLGVAVPPGGAGEWQLTIHGDDLFSDDLFSGDDASEDPVLRLSAIMAADSNDDDVIDIGELNAVDLTSLPADQYGVGGASDVLSLGDFVGALSSTLVHHTGDGECTAEKR